MSEKTYKIRRITPRTEALVRELGGLGAQIDADLLTVASEDARDEWRALLARWPSPEQVRQGIVGCAEDDLVEMVGKVRRFKTILEAVRAHAEPFRVPAANMLSASA
jgi:hypothetical protein